MCREQFHNITNDINVDDVVVETTNIANESFLKDKFNDDEIQFQFLLKLKISIILLRFLKFFNFFCDHFVVFEKLRIKNFIVLFVINLIIHK